MVPPLPTGPGKHQGHFIGQCLNQKPCGPQGNFLAFKDMSKVKLVKRCSQLFGPRAKADGTDQANVYIQAALSSEQ